MSRPPIPVPSVAPVYTDAAFGTWGEFETAGGQVLYLSTQVSMSGNSEFDANSMIETIAPVREVLDVTKLDFAELLQRDLEDHRVLTGLIPYLMNEENQGRGFFPPILAVLLPFTSGQPSDFLNGEEIEVEEGEITYQQLASAGYFQLRRTKYGPGEDLVRSQRTAELRWNKNKAKMVVIDGQHRAMALLAIYRTLAGEDRWSASSGAKYRHFYFDQIEKLWKDRPLPRIEVPVTVCIFPDLLGTGKGELAHRAARKLFVDVNREAKTPNRSRLILLSETNLAEIFTRRLLDQVKSGAANSDTEALPLSAIEYDTPGQNEKNRPPQRRLCITTVEFLVQIVYKVVWGSDIFIADILRLQQRDRGGSDLTMRKQLRLPDLDPNDFVFDGGKVVPLSEIRGDHFPSEAVHELSEIFMEQWGEHLLRLFSEVQPFKTFREAIYEFDSNWNVVADEEMGLAKEALFTGVGSYWTLKEMNETWRLEREKQPAAHRKTYPKTSSVKAWEIVESEEDKFWEQLTRSYSSVASPTDNDLLASQEAIERSRTLAVQTGLAATFATLVYTWKIPTGSLVDFREAFIARLNEFLDSDSTVGRVRKFIFSSHQPDSDPASSFYSFVRGLDAKRWVHMRWIFMIVFFYSPFNWKPEMVGLVGQDALDTARNDLGFKALNAYVNTVVDERVSRDLPKPIDPADRAVLEPKLRAEMFKKFTDWFDSDYPKLVSSGSTETADQLEAVDEDEEENGDFDD